MNWYYLHDGEEFGPHTEPELVQGYREGEVFPYTLIRPENHSDWHPFSEYFGGGRTIPPEDAPEVHTAPPAGQIICSICDHFFPTEDLINFSSQSICINCKPVYFQQLREGVVKPNFLTYASFGRRALARFLDGLFLLGITSLLLLPFTFSDNKSIRYQLIMNIPVVFIEALYYIYFHATTGATPGKSLVNIRAVNELGESMGYLRAGGRYMAQYISVITLGIGFLMALFDAQNRTLHDHICATRVIRPDSPA